MIPFAAVDIVPVISLVVAVAGLGYQVVRNHRDARNRPRLDLSVAEVGRVRVAGGVREHRVRLRVTNHAKSRTAEQVNVVVVDFEPPPSNRVGNDAAPEQLMVPLLWTTATAATGVNIGPGSSELLEFLLFADEGGRPRVTLETTSGREPVDVAIRPGSSSQLGAIFRLGVRAKDVRDQRYSLKVHYDGRWPFTGTDMHEHVRVEAVPGLLPSQPLPREASPGPATAQEGVVAERRRERAARRSERLRQAMPRFGPIGALVVLILALVYLVAQGGDDDDPFPTPREERVLAVMPPAVRHNCHREHDLIDGALAGVRCDLTRGAAAHASYQLFPSSSAMEKVATKHADALELPEAGCRFRHNSVSNWTIDGKYAGRLLCYQDRGIPHVEWSTNSVNIYATAEGRSHDDRALYEWWLGADPNSSYDRKAFPDFTERELLTHVPAGVRASCVRGSYYPTNAAASLRCPVKSGASFVLYVSFDETTELKRFFGSRLAGLRKTTQYQKGACTTSERSFIHSYTISNPERRGGMRACYVLPEGAVIEWSNEPLAIYAFAQRDDQSLPALFQWWYHRAGPIDK